MSDTFFHMSAETRRLRHRAKRCVGGRKIFPRVRKRRTSKGELYYVCNWGGASPPKAILEVAFLAQVDFETDGIY